MNFDKEKCDEWEKIRLNSSPKNPFTKRNVKKDGPTYKKNRILFVDIMLLEEMLLI